MRINKFIALTGFCSRRKADELIEQGKVRVNGEVVKDFSFQLKEADKVKIDGKILTLKEKKYVAFHKPAGYITSCSDEKGRKTIYDILPKELHSLKPAGRLDKLSSGLLILTNDGDFINKITHPSKKIPKGYLVTVKGRFTKQNAENFSKGIEIEKDKIAYAEVEILESLNKKSQLKMTLYQGYNRQIRRMLETTGHEVISLKRVSHGRVKLGKLNKGEYRDMTEKEKKCNTLPRKT